MNLDELKTMSAEELETLIATAQEVLNSKKEEVVYVLSGKALNPASYKQIQFFGKLGGINKTSSSQILKRMEMHDMSEAIDALQSGKKVIIR
jgi:hypothetical protein